MESAGDGGPTSGEKAGAPPPRWHRAAVLASMAVALALSLRFAGRSGLFRDEAQMLRVLEIPSFVELLRFLKSHEWHPPLFYGLMWLWQAAFGRSEAVALALPIACGLALVPAVYAVGARLASPRAGLIAAALVALSPLFAQHAALVRPYSLLPLLCLGSLATLWTAALSGRRRDWLAHVALTASMVYAHNWAWLVLGAEWCAFVVWWALERRRGARTPIAPWLASQVAVLVLYAPWLPALLEQRAHGGHNPVPVAAWDALSTFAIVVTSVPNRALAWGVLLLAAVAFGVGEASDPARGSARHRLTLLLLAGVPALAFAAAAGLSFETNLLLPRCLLMTAPAVVILIAMALERLRAALHPAATLLATGGLLVVYAVSLDPMLALVKSNAREVAARVEGAAVPQDLIVVTPEWLAASFNYYFRASNPQLDFPHQGRLEANAWNDLTERMADPQALASARALLAEARQRRQRVFLVTDIGYISEPQRMADEGLAAEGAARKDWMTVGIVRSNQLLEQLVALYGPPVASEVPNLADAGFERLVMLRFEAPPDAAPPPPPASVH